MQQENLVYTPTKQDCMALAEWSVKHIDLCRKASWSVFTNNQVAYFLASALLWFLTDFPTAAIAFVIMELAIIIPSRGEPRKHCYLRTIGKALENRNRKENSYGPRIEMTPNSIEIFETDRTITLEMSEIFGVITAPNHLFIRINEKESFPLPIELLKNHSNPLIYKSLTKIA